MERLARTEAAPTGGVAAVRGGHVHSCVHSIVSRGDKAACVATLREYLKKEETQLRECAGVVLNQEVLTGLQVTPLLPLSARHASCRLVSAL